MRGWESIATNLLETGQCIVAGKDCIWRGGIGNFIKIEEAKGAVDCILYKFDSDGFFESEWYREIRNSHHLILLTRKKEIDQKCEEIANI